MWPCSAQTQILLATSHTMDVRVTAYTAATGAVPGIPVTDGTVTISATSQVRRTATLDIAAPDYWPTDPFDVLSPLGSELQVEYGIAAPGRETEWIPVIRGMISEVARVRPVAATGAAFTVNLVDLSAKVAQARFEQPTQTIAGRTVVSEITRLIKEAIPAATVESQVVTADRVAPQITMERERWSDGIEKLADSIGAEVFADPVGTFIIRPQPVITATPVWSARTGDGGTVITLDEKQTRDLTYNKVVASGQRVDNTPPVWAAVADTDPKSPTYVGGPFGLKTRFYVSPLLTTTAQCTTAAASLLARTIGMHGSISLDLITNPLLDCGDVVAIVDGATSSNHIIDSLTVPLHPKNAQRLSTRTLTLPQEV